MAEDSIRHYPFGSFLSHVLGFAGIDNQGLLGLEAYYDDDLKGEKGSVKFYTDAKGKKCLMKQTTIPRQKTGWT